MNGRDNVYGDATLTEARIAEVTAAESRNHFFNRTHQQDFSERDTARNDIYDGYNLRAPHINRTMPLEHSWRATLPQQEPRMQPEGIVARQD